jgi:glycosyltransferase involved in cell wall biosynthesis
LADGRGTPCVSVVLPVRDGAEFLAVAAESILGQTLSNLELLIIDDGSQDATPAMLDRLAASDQRIRVLRQAPLGVTAALNRGLGEAKATFVARMDADDIAAPERLARQHAALNAHPNAAAIGSGCRVIDRDGRLLGYRRPPTQPKAIRQVLLRGNCMIHPTIMLRREPVLEVGGYRASFRYCEDFDLWLRLSEHYDLINLPEPLLDYREHDRQLTWQNLEERVMTELAALVLAAERRAGHPDFIDGDTRIDREFLLTMGVSERRIANHIIASTLATAREAINAGLARPGREALELLLRQPALRTRTRMRAFGLLMRSYVNLRPPRLLLHRQQPV